MTCCHVFPSELLAQSHNSNARLEKSLLFTTAALLIQLRHTIHTCHRSGSFEKLVAIVTTARKRSRGGVAVFVRSPDMLRKAANALSGACIAFDEGWCREWGLTAGLLACGWIVGYLTRSCQSFFADLLLCRFSTPLFHFFLQSVAALNVWPTDKLLISVTSTCAYDAKMQETRQLFEDGPASAPVLLVLDDALTFLDLDVIEVSDKSAINKVGCE